MTRGRAATADTRSTNGPRLARGLVAALATAALISAPAPASAGVDPEQELLRRLSADLGRTVSAKEIVAAAEAPGQTLVALARRPGTGHYKAASVYAATGAGRFHQLNPYLMYDGGCYDGDEVCVQSRPDLGFVAIHRRPDGQSAVLVSTPFGRPATAQPADGDAFTTRPGVRGWAYWGRTKDAWKIRVAVTREDGQRYTLFLPPGAVSTNPA